MARNLTNEERKYYTAEFLRIDSNGNGWLSRIELKMGIRKWNGEKFTDFESEKIFRVVDSNQDGKITLDEFLDLIGKSKQKS